MGLVPDNHKSDILFNPEYYKKKTVAYTHRVSDVGMPIWTPKLSVQVKEKLTQKKTSQKNQIFNRNVSICS